MTVTLYDKKKSLASCDQGLSSDELTTLDYAGGSSGHIMLTHALTCLLISKRETLHRGAGNVETGQRALRRVALKIGVMKPQAKRC